MKNKYLMKILCITLISTMVLASPVSIMASAEEGFTVNSEDAGSVTETPSPEPTETPTPDPTGTPSPEPTGTPDPTPTDTPSPSPTPSPEPTETPEPDEISKETQEVIDLIDSIPSNITLDCEEIIVEAEEAYENLSDEEKAMVYNYVTLLQARELLDELKENEAEKPEDGSDSENSFNDSDSNSGDSFSSENTNVQVGQKVTIGSSSISNLHAGKGFYLDSLEENYNLSFSDDFAEVMEEIEQEYKDANKLVDVSDTEEDHLTSSRDNLLVRNWQDILAVYIYQQSKEGTDTFTLDETAKEELAEIFAQMNPVVRDKKNITKVSYGNYHINNYIKENNISQNDRGVLKKYVETDCKLLCAIVTDAKGFVRQSVGDDVSEERVNVITAAYSLVGEVGYFWGGKSTKIGEDPSWGTAEKVSAAGSASTGTVRAYGLDCSGFVTWSVINGYLNQGMQSSVGDGTSDQWEKANVVSEQDAQPGDLVFQKGPEAGSDNHVGIICGKTNAGDWIAVHCSSGKNGVTVGEAYGASFRYIRQPSFYPTQAEVAQMQSEGASASNAEAVSTAETTDSEETLTSGENVAEEILTSDTGDRDSTADASEEVEITIVDDVEDEAFTSGDSVTVTSPVKDVLQEILDQNVFDSSDSDNEILPKKADTDDSDIEIVFED